MKLPESGRVVVIDDEFGEALPLLQVLTRNRTPSFYCSNKPAELPNSPLTGIRVVFLDLQLVPTTDPKSMCSAIAAVLKKTLSAKNGPYLLFVWSKHEADCLAQAKALFEGKLKDIKPAQIISLEKTAYLQSNGAGGWTFVHNALDLIEAKLKTELKSANAFHLFLIWENAVSNAATSVVNEVSALYAMDADWETNMASVFRELASAWAGKHLDGAPQDKICSAALSAFGSLYSDGLERGLSDCDFSGLGTIPDGKPLDEAIRASLNRRLFITAAVGNTRPGDVFGAGRGKPATVWDAFDPRYAATSYAVSNKLRPSDVLDDNGRVVEAHKKEIKKESDRLRDEIAPVSIEIKVEVSPACDWAQKKWRMHRFVKGILWPQKHGAAIRRADYLYVTPPFEWKGKGFHAVLDLRHLYASVLRPTIPRRIFTLRNELLVDVQQKLAHHISRPGIQSV